MFAPAIWLYAGNTNGEDLVRAMISGRN